MTILAIYVVSYPCHHMNEPIISLARCPSCAPGLPICVSCYLDQRDRERMEEDRLDTLEGYFAGAPSVYHHQPARATGQP